MAQRRDDIDTLRGLACLLLVALHVIGEQPSHGLGVPMDHPLAIAETFTFHIRMPLFAALAGFVYAFRPVERGALGGFLTGKLRRLAVPMVFAATVFWLMNLVTGGAFMVPVERVWEVYLFSYAQFWFIHAVLWCFLAIALIDLALPRRPIAAGLVMLAGGTALFLSPLAQPMAFLSIEQTLYLVPFFAAGVILSRLPAQWVKRAAIPLGAAGLTFFAVHAMNILADPMTENVRRALFSLGAGLAISAGLIAWRPSFAPMAWIGRYSFTIYLYHLIVAKAFHRAYEMAGSPEPYLGALAGIAVATLIPVVLHWIALKAGGPVPPLTLGIKGRPWRLGRMPGNRLPSRSPAE